MRLHAYVLAGDPAWATESLTSYYPLVDRVVVSFDRGHLSWSGRPMPVEAAIATLRLADPDGKIVLAPGNYSDPSRPFLDSETDQRHAALDAASEGADWVLQLDTDEIALDAGGAEALDYPLRDMYQQVGPGRYLEHCGRFWKLQAAYPGPIAVKAGTTLRHCRQTGAPLYRVDVSWHNTDPAHPRDVRVHAVVRPDQALAHMSWVRTPEEMALKAATSGHAGTYVWDNALAPWTWRGRHPFLTAAAVPFARDPFQRYRISRLPVERAASR